MAAAPAAAAGTSAPSRRPPSPRAAGAEKKPEPVRNLGKKVGRNDPCPCGSGKKFKACCMRKEAVQRPFLSTTGRCGTVPRSPAGPRCTADLATGQEVYVATPDPGPTGRVRPRRGGASRGHAGCSDGTGFAPAAASWRPIATGPGKDSPRCPCVLNLIYLALIAGFRPPAAGPGGPVGEVPRRLGGEGAGRRPAADRRPPLPLVPRGERRRGLAVAADPPRAGAAPAGLGGRRLDDDADRPGGGAAVVSRTW